FPGKVRVLDMVCFMVQWPRPAERLYLRFLDRHQHPYSDHPYQGAKKMRSFHALIPRALLLCVTTLISLSSTRSAHAQSEPHRGGEANLVLQDLYSVEMLGMPGGQLLLWGVLVCVLGLVFGVVTLKQVKDLPSHRSMTEISQLIWETCKT